MVRGGTKERERERERRGKTRSSLGPLLSLESSKLGAGSSQKLPVESACACASPELDYTAKGYIYRARMYAEARTSPQRGRGFSLDATWGEREREREGTLAHTRGFGESAQTPLRSNGLPNFPLLASAPSFLIPLRRLLHPSPFFPRIEQEFTLSITFYWGNSIRRARERKHPFEWCTTDINSRWSNPHFYRLWGFLKSPGISTRGFRIRQIGT